MGIKKFILCYILGLHDWTCKADEGIKTLHIDKEVANSSPEEVELAFWEYAKMYCKCCGTVSELSQRQIDRAKDELDKKERSKKVKELLGIKNW